MELLTDLSRCAFPFMCAHGRVSMVPLVEMGGASVEGFGLSSGGLVRESIGGDIGFVSAFGRWRSGDEDSLQIPGT